MVAETVAQTKQQPRGPEGATCVLWNGNDVSSGIFSAHILLFNLFFVSSTRLSHTFTALKNSICQSVQAQKEGELEPTMAETYKKTEKREFSLGYIQLNNAPDGLIKNVNNNNANRCKYKHTGKRFIALLWHTVVT